MDRFPFPSWKQESLCPTPGIANPDCPGLFFTQEAHIVDAMKKSLDAIWTPSRYTMPVNQGQLVQARLTNEAFSMTTPRVTSLAEAALPAAPRVDPVSLKALSRDIAAGEAGLPGTNPTDVAPRDRRAGGREANSVDDECSLLSGAVASGGGDGKSVKQPSERSEEADCKKGRPRGDSKGAANMLGASQGTKPSLSPSNVSVPHGGDGKVSSRNPPKRPRRGERYGLGDEESGESPRPRQDVHVEERALNGNRQRTDVLGDDDDVLGQFGGARTHTNKAKERLRVSDTLGKGNRESTSKEGVSDGADGTSSKGVDTGGDGAGANGRLGDTLAFDLTAILAGSRSASRRKRKRDHRNASAYSFSGSLSGGASAEEADSKAAARVFSRVLHKVHGVVIRVVRCCFTGILDRRHYRLYFLCVAVRCHPEFGYACKIMRAEEVRSYALGILALLRSAYPSSIPTSRSFGDSGVLFPRLRFTGALHEDARRRSVQPGLHHMPSRLGPIHSRPARLR